ncbi:MAG: thioredoxin domain-containing protein [Deltaproteobacteria bacterium]|nr:thioredoxin domain-containing protein [Deltaproteobacteria bacterium]
MPMAKKKHNRLSHEKSPYLLEHADNPVDWYPWGPEAFERAGKEEKPIFLSIGYSTCHWCHVMARESFQDYEVARLMNDAFVSIKVDREERPDIDNIYMTVCQMMTGGGGWPLTIIMTPDKQAFFAETYLPKQSRFGKIGMLELIPRIKEIWTTRRAETVRAASQVTASLRQISCDSPGEELDVSMLNTAYEELLQRFDEKHGGFGGAPKFPTPHILSFLLRYWKRTGNDHALTMVEKTLRALRCGGIYDHIGFGFHRYSTDAEWLVPHFEKMLYDQALIALSFIEAHQATRRPEYRETAEEIFAYIIRDMTAPEGGFYSAEDAESEGEEGRFYVWTDEEIRGTLGDKADLIVKVLSVSKEGNYEDEISHQKTGKNILHLKKALPALSEELGIPDEELLNSIEKARERLFDARQKRIHPHKDDKILTDWNGLMIAALARGAQAFDELTYSEAAVRAANFILRNMRGSNGRLLHRYRDGEAAITAKLNDHVFLIWGLIELYETTFEAQYLQAALDLNRDLLTHFWDDKGGGFYLTADDDENLPVRPKEIYDGALPSGNSVAMLNLLRLGRITGRYDLEEKAVRIGRTFSRAIAHSPSAHTQLMIAVDYAAGPFYEITIAGYPRKEDTSAMIQALRKAFVPNKVVVFRPIEEGTPDITRIAEFTKDHVAIDGTATAYVCRNHACKEPTTDINKMIDFLT